MPPAAAASACPSLAELYLSLLCVAFMILNSTVANMILCVAAAAAVQASLVAEEVLREGGDAVRVVFNKFHSAISFKPTMATVLNAEVRHTFTAGFQITVANL
jgi:F0F1-type ATP synthase gamma subunit